MVTLLKIFGIVNSIFWSFIWLTRLPRAKLEQLQESKDTGGLSLPNLWLFYLAAQLQNIVQAMPLKPVKKGGNMDSESPTGLCNKGE